MSDRAWELFRDAYVAARDGEHDKLRRLLENPHYPHDEHHAGEGSTCLGIASQNGHSSCVELLLQSQMGRETANAQNIHGSTALMVAACGGHHKCVQLLLQDARMKATTVIAENDRKQNALQLACVAGSLETLKLLLHDSRTTSASVNALDVERGTGFAIACQEGHDRCVELLLNSPHFRQESVNWLTSHGTTPLGIACANGHDRCVELLLDSAGMKQETINAQTTGGISALHAACTDGHECCVDRLLKSKADATQMEHSNGTTALHVAAWSGQDGCVMLLLEVLDSANATDTHGWTALDYATGHNVGDVDFYLPELRPDVMGCDQCVTLLRQAGGQPGTNTGAGPASGKRQRLDTPASASTAGGEGGLKHAPRRPARGKNGLEQELRSVFGGAIPSRIKEALLKREQIVYRQELACVSYLAESYGGDCTRQKTLQKDGVSVRADVFLERQGQPGMPWEVKECDDVHKLQSAHGQATFSASSLAPTSRAAFTYLLKRVQQGRGAATSTSLSRRCCQPHESATPALCLHRLWMRMPLLTRPWHSMPAESLL